MSVALARSHAGIAAPGLGTRHRCMSGHVGWQAMRDEVQYAQRPRGLDHKAQGVSWTGRRSSLLKTAQSS